MSNKSLFIAFVTVGLVGCGGSGGTGVAVNGLLVFNNTQGAGTQFLYRLPKGGGTIVPVPGTTAAFEGSMDQVFDIFTSDATGNIVKTVGGSSTSLTSSTHDFRPCVTPDGSKIAFVSSRDGNNEVYTMSGTGSGQTNVSNSSGSDSFAAISQDGSKVVFTSGRDGNSEIYIVDFNGSNLTRLTNNAAEDVTPAFTPDGTHVIFSSNRTGGIYQIYEMDTAGGNVTQLTTDSTDKFHASFAVNGSKIFYYTGAAPRNVWSCNANGSGQIQLTNLSTDTDKMATWVY